VDRIGSDLTSGTSDEKRECMGYDNGVNIRPESETIWDDYIKVSFIFCCATMLITWVE
jgi:hypothetical protein